MNVRLSSGAALIVLAGANADVAQAQRVTYAFSGVVTDVNVSDQAPHPLGFNVGIGQPISGTLTYDLDAPGTVVGTGPNDVPILTSYVSPRMSVTYTIGSVTVSGPASVYVGDGAASAVIEADVDTFFAVMDSTSPSPLTSFVRLEDTSRSVFSSTELSPTLPLTSFDLRQVELQQQLPDNTGHRYLNASIRSFARVGKEVAVDIRPRTSANRIDPASDETVPVAILSTNSAEPGEEFDATRVNPMSVRFGGRGRDVAAVRVVERDVDDDGDTDLLFRFRSRDIGLNCMDSSATLRGQTFAGRVVQGTDSVTVLGCDTP